MPYFLWRRVYLQEAGRAGRDRAAAECVLLYDEHDVEDQFRMGAASRLDRREIAGILRALRRARRGDSDEVAITSGELLRDEEAEIGIELDDRQADTKVRTAVAWLERAGFVERRENRAQVFQGRPRVKDLAEGMGKIEALGLPPWKKRRWLAVLEALLAAEGDDGFSADELALLPAFRSSEEAKGREERPAHEVLRTLQQMAEQGLIDKRMILTAFLRYTRRQWKYGIQGAWVGVPGKA